MGDVELPPGGRGGQQLAPPIAFDVEVITSVGGDAHDIEAQVVGGIERPVEVIGLRDENGIGHTENVACSVAAIIGAAAGIVEHNVPIGHAQFESIGRMWPGSL